MHLCWILGSCNVVTEDSCLLACYPKLDTKQLLILTFFKKCCTIIFRVSSQKRCESADNERSTTCQNTGSCLPLEKAEHPMFHFQHTAQYFLFTVPTCFRQKLWPSSEATNFIASLFYHTIQVNSARLYVYIIIYCNIQLGKLKVTYVTV